jgi:hypothetical protein
MIGMLAAFALQAGAASNPLEPLLGQWTCQGGVNGRESSVLMIWEPVLEGRFVRLSWRNSLSDADGTQRFEGDAYYTIGEPGDLSGAWFDSQGSQHRIEATMSDGVLTAHWSNDKSAGRTRYTVTDIGIDVEDAIATKSGEFRIFGRVSCEPR